MLVGGLGGCLADCICLVHSRARLDVDRVLALLLALGLII